MAGSTDTDLWATYTRTLSKISAMPAESIRRDSSIGDDLGMDSLGIVELVVALIERFKAEDMEEALGSEDWKRLTVGDLFDRYVSNAGRRGVES